MPHTPRALPFSGTAVLAATLFCLAAVGPAYAETTVAVAEFDYSDTSGEPGNQTEAHAKRLEILSSTIRDELAKHGMTARPLPCDAAPCSAGALGLERTLAAAKAIDARYVVHGGIHKMSTLLQWMKVDVLDVATSTTAASPLLTFRGDTDEAFERAGRFVSNTVLQQTLPKP